ncbi:MAG TPA: hypothetical protein VGE15_10580 [Sphingobacteriaceae bacterium]
MNTITELPARADKRANTRFLRIVLGAGLAAILLTVLLLVSGNGQIENGGWLIFSYLVVPTAGALGGLIADRMQPLRDKGGFYYFLGISVSILMYASLFSLSFMMAVNGVR